MTQSISANPDIRLGGSQSFRDFLGIAASVLCAIHCAAMPFVVGFLPLLGLSFLADPSFHKWMVGVCLVLALLAFVPGWRRHRRLQPTIIGLCGLGLISFAAFAGPEDCCPTPCSASVAAADPSATDEECAASCCSVDETIPAPDDQGSETVLVVEGESCAAACCDSATPATEAMADSGCSEACCPEDEAVLVTASTGGFMELFWLLMTPVGGVILVTAHLVNHRLGCRCRAGCCA